MPTCGCCPGRCSRWAGRSRRRSAAGWTVPRSAWFVAVPRALGDDIVDPTVRVERERTVAPGEVSERIRVVSFADSGVDTELVLTVAADLAGLGEIKAARAGQPVPLTPVHDGLSWGDAELTVALAAPGAELACDPATNGAEPSAGQVRLDGRGTSAFSWRLTVTDPAASVVAAPQRRALAGPRHRRRPAAGGARRPLAGRRGCPADGRCPAVPATCSSPRARRGTSPSSAGTASGPRGCCCRSAGSSPPVRSARWRRARAASSTRRPREAPGKIPHELRRAAAAPLYYGTIDATPLWICLLHDAWRWGMPDRPGAGAAARAAGGAGRACAATATPTATGCSSTSTRAGTGCPTRAGRTRATPIRFADGRIADAAGRAVRGPGVRLRGGDGRGRAADRVRRARRAAAGGTGRPRWPRRFRASFWLPGGYPALALDAAKQPVDSLTSNIGHLLGTGLLTADGGGAGRRPAVRPGHGLGLRAAHHVRRATPGTTR